jgi:hypothetical protein
MAAAPGLAGMTSRRGGERVLPHGAAAAIFKRDGKHKDLTDVAASLRAITSNGTSSCGPSAGMWRIRSATDSSRK